MSVLKLKLDGGRPQKRIKLHIPLSWWQKATLEDLDNEPVLFDKLADAAEAEGNARAAMLLRQRRADPTVNYGEYSQWVDSQRKEAS